MTTECTAQPIVLQTENHRALVARFDGGTISSDAGMILLKQVEQATGIIRQFAACFTDYRNPDLIDHSLYELIAQRVYALALGYEDLNDHDVLRLDPLLATLVGKKDPHNEPLAGKSTLNRLELTPVRADEKSRYKKIVVHRPDVDRFLVDAFTQSYPSPPASIVLDLDATDDPIHGDQLGKFFHGYYKNYCYLPLYIFCGDQLLCARLRPSDIDGSAGSVKELDRIVSQIRRAWPRVQILVRGDSGFCRERIMAWCETHDVDYVLGLARNRRLQGLLAESMMQARSLYEQTGQASRVFSEFQYQTLDSWSRSRRVVGKAEMLSKGANPRFVVTSLTAEQNPAQPLYEQTYCARGEMENRIKEQQLYLFADRTSCATMRANQTRLWFSSVAYMLLEALRRMGLKNTEMAQATCQTIRLKLLKVGAQIQVTVRKVWVRLSQSYPFQLLFWQIHQNLMNSSSYYPLRC